MTTFFSPHKQFLDNPPNVCPPVIQSDVIPVQWLECYLETLESLSGKGRKGSLDLAILFCRQRMSLSAEWSWGFLSISPPPLDEKGGETALVTQSVLY